MADVILIANMPITIPLWMLGVLHGYFIYYVLFKDDARISKLSEEIRKLKEKINKLDGKGKCKMAYKLTDKIPTEPGYYWAKSIHGGFMLIEVDKQNICLCHGHRMKFELSDFVAWSERIEEPEE